MIISNIVCISRTSTTYTYIELDVYNSILWLTIIKLNTAEEWAVPQIMHHNICN